MNGCNEAVQNLNTGSGDSIWMWMLNSGGNTLSTRTQKLDTFTNGSLIKERDEMKDELDRFGNIGQSVESVWRPTV